MAGLRGRNYCPTRWVSVVLTQPPQCSDQSGNETAEDSDDELQGVRGRHPSQKTLQNDVRSTSARMGRPTSFQHASSPISLDYSNESKQISSLQRRMSFTRSRSPHPQILNNAANGAHPPSVSLPQRHKPLPVVRALLPAMISTSTRLPFLGTFSFCMDTRYMGESLLLIGSLAFFNSKLSDDTIHTIDSSLSLGEYCLHICEALFQY